MNNDYQLILLYSSLGNPLKNIFSQISFSMQNGTASSELITLKQKQHNKNNQPTKYLTQKK